MTLALIREGQAISIMPGLRASHDLAEVEVCGLRPEIRRRVSLAFRRGEKHSPALDAFLALAIRSAGAVARGSPA